MTITRKLLGFIPVQITLTEQEIYSAYAEKQHDYDMEDINSKIECRWEEDEIPERLNDPEVISDIADRLRRYLDDNDCISECLWRCADDAIDVELEEE